MGANATVLLTGATGLVGRFLLAGLMRRGIPTIVLVRSQHHRSALARIEEALHQFESTGALPRPVVIEADLNKPGLGLTSEHHRVLASQEIRILHSAASIRFNADGAVHADGSGSEPYATNVAGTRHLLDAARSWQVIQFHHVSTAYVQCDRLARRTAFEVPVESDASAGNDYERSKIQSEKLIRDCTHIGIKTFYRPSIVVGDSVTGYTSTYHGFYAPLQIAATLIRTLRLDRPDADKFREQLGLSPNDTKNIVPVDWLAAAILRLMEQSRAHGQIYHLTHPQPARLLDMQAAIIDAIQEVIVNKNRVLTTSGTAPYQKTEPLDGPKPELPEDQLTAFRQQLAVYESYFLNDPPFDRSLAERYLRDLKCPVMDYALLKKLALRALEDNFGWPRPRVDLPRPQLLQIRSRSNGAVGSPSGPLVDVELVLELLGPTGARLPENHPPIFCRRAGQWNAIPVLSSSAHSGVLRLMTTEQSLRMAIDGRAAPEHLLAQGRWIVCGTLPGGWMDVLRDWVECLRISDADKQA